jgi:xanthine dehydrogenase accessory factor
MDDTLRTLISQLGQGRSVAQAVILTHEGSTPRSAGSRMLLVPEGSGGVAGAGAGRPVLVAGTVGGGLVEARVMAAAAEVLATGARRVEAFDLTGELAAGADMICGGRVRVFLQRLDPADLPLLARLAEELDRGGRCLLLTPLDQGPAALLLPGGTCGAMLAPGLERAARAAGEGIDAPLCLDFAGRAYALEPFAAATPLYIFGAGHVSRPTAQVAALCGFAVTVLDDRPEFASPERFPGARTRVLASFAESFAGLPAGPGSFVVIVTRGHVHDADVLAQALHTPAAYIGMIGSRRKRDAVYARLRGQGFTDADLERVHCPVGLDIAAETPEEIAVSINAEMIRARAALRGA